MKLCKLIEKCLVIGEDTHTEECRDTSVLYKEPSIISGTGAAIWPNTIFGPNEHHHHRSSPLPRVYTISSACHFLNALWESCSTRVLITPRDSTSINTIV
jgi:hypothetical protein